MPSRRSFLGATLAAAAAPVLTPRLLDQLEPRLAAYSHASPQAAATDDAFWAEIRRAFPRPSAYIHLENGYSSPQPAATFEAFGGYTRQINDGLSLYMRRKRADDYLAVKAELAALAGVSPGEIAITRNTTESLGTVIHGLDLAPGDEALVCNQDYGSMLEQFRQQSKRRGLKLVDVDVPLHPKSDADVVGAYERAMTPRTKVMLVSHMINISGHILPVKKIAAMAHARGVDVIADAAHSFAHVNYAVPDLDADYLGASLHKWLSTPLGAGLLYVRKSKIAGVWPLLGETSVPVDDIRKFERLGTQPPWTMLAIRDAIRFHTMIGAARKEARLRWLQQYWTSRVRGLKKVYLNTPDGDRACGIANAGVTGMTPTALATTLSANYGIYTVAIDTGPVKGVRVTPHLFTTTADLDALVKALTELGA